MTLRIHTHTHACRARACNALPSHTLHCTSVGSTNTRTGAHILSGCALEPKALDELLPGWRDEEGGPTKARAQLCCTCRPPPMPVLHSSVALSPSTHACVAQLCCTCRPPPMPVLHSSVALSPSTHACAAQLCCTCRPPPTPVRTRHTKQLSSVAPVALHPRLCALDTQSNSARLHSHPLHLPASTSAMFLQPQSPCPRSSCPTGTLRSLPRRSQ